MFIKKLIQSFDYAGLGEFGQSIMPSIKYGATGMLGILSAIIATGVTFIETKLGIGDAAFVALSAVMLFDLISGITASKVKGDRITGIRWSHFALKAGLWFIVIYVTHVVADDFRSREMPAVASIIDWIHTALILNIFFEYLLSVLENISIIGGKDNSTLIEKIREKIKNLF